MKQTTFEKQLEMYSVFIRDIIRRNQELLESEQINAIDKELLKYCHPHAQQQHLHSRMLMLETSPTFWMPKDSSSSMPCTLMTFALN